MGGVAAHVLFDSGASHCFVQPEMIGIGGFQKEEEDVRPVPGLLTQLDTNAYLLISLLV